MKKALETIARYAANEALTRTESTDHYSVFNAYVQLSGKPEDIMSDYDINECEDDLNEKYDLDEDADESDRQYYWNADCDEHNYELIEKLLAKFGVSAGWGNSSPDNTEIVIQRAGLEHIRPAANVFLAKNADPEEFSSDYNYEYTTIEDAADEAIQTLMSAKSDSWQKNKARMILDAIDNI